MDEEEINEEEEVNELYNDVNINLKGRDTEIMDSLLANVQTTEVIEDTHVIIMAITPEVQHQSSSVSSGFISNMLNPNPDTSIDSILNLNTESTSLVDVLVTTNVKMPPSSVTTLPPPPIPLVQPLQQTPIPIPTIALSTSLQNLPTFGSLFKFEDRVKALPDDFSEFKQTNLFAEAVSSIPNIVDMYLANKMNEAVKAVVQLQSDRLRSEAQADNEYFINKIDENMKKIIKEQVKIQVKEQYILATYGDTITLKRCLNDEDEDEEPSAGSNRGSKRRRAGEEPESTSAPKKKTSKSSGKSKEGSKSHQKSTGKSAQAEEPIHADEDLEEPAHQEFDIGFTEDQPIDETTQHPDWISTLARNEDPHESFNELMDTPLDFSAFNNPKGQQYPHDLRKPLALIPNSRGRRVIPFDHFINNDLAYLSGGVSSRTYATSVTKIKATDYGHVKWIEGRKRQQFYGFVVNREYARDVYSKHRILAITKLKIVEWHNYKHLDWITVCRNDEKLYTFKEGDYNRLRFQYIEDMLLLLVQGKLTNLNVEEHKKNRLMRIDELHKFSDGTLNDVRFALDDILKRIQMDYLPHTVWRNVDMERAGAMIQAID
ncbi:hypothetical protein Tco_1098917 [Tanacetum coccineum]